MPTPRMLAVCALLLAVPAIASVPVVISHDGYLLDGDDQPVTTASTFAFSLYKNATPPASGPDETWWSGAAVSLTPKQGLYSVLLGGAETGPLTVDVFDGPGERWLGVTVNGIALLPRRKVVSTPYALVASRASTAVHAASADEATHAASADVAASATAADSATTAAFATNADTLDDLDSTDFAAAVHDHDSLYLRRDGSNAQSAPLASLTTAAPAGTSPLAASYTATTSTWRRPITISNAGSALTDYQLLVTLDTATPISQGRMRVDGNDLRFTAADGTTQLPFFIESGMQSSSTLVWVRVPSIPSGSSTIYATYGNGALPSASSAAGVFLFYDSFESTSGWTQLDAGCPGGNPLTASAGVLSLKCQGTGANNWVHNRIEKPLGQTLSSGAFAFRMKVREGRTNAESCGSAAGALVGAAGGAQRLIAGARSYTYCNNTSNNSLYFAGVEGPHTDPLVANLSGGFTVVEARFNLDTRAATSFTNGVQGTSVTGNTATTLSAVSFWAGMYNTQNEELQVDEVLLRRHSATPPTAAIGSEESVGVQQVTLPALAVQADTGFVGIGTATPTSRLDVRGGFLTDDRTFFTDYGAVNGASALPLLGRNGLPLAAGHTGEALCTARSTGYAATSSWLFESSDNGTTDAAVVIRVQSFNVASPTPELFADSDRLIKLRLFGGAGATTPYNVRCRIHLVTP